MTFFAGAECSHENNACEEKQKGRVGRPRTKPEKKKADWHYHLGGVRQAR